MRVLLVDDKESVVQGIRKHIPWEQLGITHVDIAFDGKEALQKFAVEPADLVVTDIKMPNMNGIELMEQLRKDYDHPMRFVVLSGYEEFDYAKQALALGASDYVLKPVDIKELTVILEKVILELQKVKEQDEQRQRFQQTIRRSLPALRQQYLNEMVHFHDLKLVRSKDKWEFAEISVRPENFALLAISIDEFQNISQNSVEEVELSRFVVDNIVGDCLTDWGTGITFYSEWGILTLLVNYNPSLPSKEIKESLLKFAETCRSSIEAYSHHTVSVGISSLCEEIRGLPEAYKEACEAIEHIYFFGSNQVMHVEDLLPFRMKRSGYPVVEEHELLTLIRRGQVESLPEGIDAFFNALKGSDSTPADFRLSCIQLATVLFRLMLDIGVQGEGRFDAPDNWYQTCEQANLTELQVQMSEWFYEAALKVKQYMQTGTKNIVGEAKAFIQQQLLQPVGLSDVADHVGVSPNYFSSLFKRETGTTFVEYITDLKLEKAKVWLGDAAIPIYEIAERLGYLDRKYFREIFKKKTGITPSEYREQRLDATKHKADE